ncbi:molybdopterin converting factor subunit 1 [Ammoniphilus sp. YIM 78166]|uniref:molybdopterin converting factor subunit 1 n=1 Tax=Ammoniphilus sp. YIM 78166 TaxID=1644106 RepID=UPI0014312264|nr:molybdopterin converting factor subunit 1 [Ammoniphilus sp. YIM 78166]
MQVNVLFFASLVDKTGTSSWAPFLHSRSTVEDMKRILIKQFPACADLLPVCHVALNQEYVKGNPVLQESDEIAIFPPVSGG